MFSESIISIGLAQTLFAAFVLATKKDRGISDWILVACLLTMALKFVMYLVHQRHAEYFDLQFSLGLIPLSFGAYLYLYTVYMTEARSTFNKRDLLHALPMVVLTALYFLFFKDEVDFSDSTYFENDAYLWVRVLFGIIVFTSIVVYTVLTLLKLRQYRQTLTEQLSYDNSQVRLVWMNVIFFLFVSLFTTYFVCGIVNAVSYSMVIDTDTLSHVGLTIIAFSVSYFGLQQSVAVQKVVLASEEPPSAPLVVDRSAKQTERFDQDEAEMYAERLDRHMKAEKPYLDPELTLHDLAMQVSMGKNDLTYLLNHHIGKNFFTYVNEFRLESVIEIFENHEYDHFTIMAVARDSGFNSKSTFNSLFKKHTGRTPSDFRKTLSTP